jgi:hypothetical protein
VYSADAKLAKWLNEAVAVTFMRDGHATVTVSGWPEGQEVWLQGDFHNADYTDYDPAERRHVMKVLYQGVTVVASVAGSEIRQYYAHGCHIRYCKRHKHFVVYAAADS